MSLEIFGWLALVAFAIWFSAAAASIAWVNRCFEASLWKTLPPLLIALCLWILAFKIAPFTIVWSQLMTTTDPKLIEPVAPKPIDLSQQDQDRFWRSVERADDDACWEWQGSLSPKGYGVFRLSTPLRNFRAHRVAWTVTNGPIPEGMMVCHRCDNPSCVNPAHLFVGTGMDNVQDRVAKGRSGAWKAKFTMEQVNAIKADPRPQTHIARHYGVDRSRIAAIKQGRAYVRIKPAIEAHKESQHG